MPCLVSLEANRKRVTQPVYVYIDGSVCRCTTLVTKRKLHPNRTPSPECEQVFSPINGVRYRC